MGKICVKVRLNPCNREAGFTGYVACVCCVKVNFCRNLWTVSSCFNSLPQELTEAALKNNTKYALLTEI